MHRVENPGEGGSSDLLDFYRIGINRCFENLPGGPKDDPHSPLYAYIEQGYLKPSQT
jgi:hypothetical protein